MKRRRRSSIGAAVNQLPEEIIVEILIRVSCAKSLWKLRCVCKSWCSLISSADFIRAHLNHSLITSNYILFKTNLYSRPLDYRPLHRVIRYEDDLPDDDYLFVPCDRVDCPVFNNYAIGPKLPIRILSTCNGLFLLQANQREFYMWNPFINKVRKLPDFVDDIDLLVYQDIPIMIHFGAFGFDQRSHDYNIVAFIQYYQKKYTAKNTTKFYSFNTDSWTRLDDFACCISLDTGKFLNGEVHWLKSTDSGLSILSLDLTSQVQTIADLPSKVNRTNSPRVPSEFPMLSMHGDRLHVLCVDGNRMCMYLWVRKDKCTVSDSSWDLVSTMPHPYSRDDITRVVFVTQKGDILLSIGRENKLYSQQRRSLGYANDFRSFPDPDICVQSLVSPFPVGMVKKKSQTGFNGYMKRRRKVIGAAVTQLPDDIIFKILIRVSCATSLWKFRSVCKSWCSLISSTNFIQAHLNNSLITSNFIMLSTTLYRPTIKIRPLRTVLFDGDLSYDDLCAAFNLDCPVFMNFDDYPPQLPIRILSTCNGLCLMLANKRDFYLWNPFINQARKLPDFVDDTDLLQHPHTPIIIHFGAFGFDERSHDYNIVAFIQYFKEKSTTKFYSFKTDSWTRLEDFECDIDHGTGKFLNVEVHWLTGWLAPTGLRILSLDLTSQVQRTADLPSKVNRTNSPQVHTDRPMLSVLRGCLHVLCVDGDRMYLWVRKDTGVSDSLWGLVSIIPHPYRDDITRVLFVTEEGDILLSKGRKNHLFSQRRRLLGYPHFRSSYPDADICIQSLVSPFPDGMVKRKSQTRFNGYGDKICIHLN